jgi:hypothetical protein
MRRLVLAIVIAFAAVPAFAEPPHHGEHEIIYTRPSGFWTSNRPAPPGHEYKWRLLEIGCAVGLLTGFLLVRTIKRANAERAARFSGAHVR